MQKENTMHSALPKLPGFSFPELNEPASHGKRQYCLVDYDGARTVLEKQAAASAPAAAAQPDGCGIPVGAILARFPQWRTLDGKVLRFFAYYVESVAESTTERERVRKVVMNYHLADGTLSIAETPAVANSGLRKGTTVSRFKPEDVTVFELTIGAAVPCRGITYELVDCDAATREFFEVMGMPQPEPLEYPFDAFEASKAPRPAGRTDEQHFEMRRAVEMQAARRAGTHASLLTPDERIAARNFFAHDGDVLRFYAVWDRRQFRIQYYLADGTISIMYDAAPNSGRDAYPVFARRARIPKNARALLLQTETLNRPIGEPPAYVTAADLRTGATVDLNTRTFFIYDCDPYTREHMEALGVPMPPCARPATEQDDYEASKRGSSMSRSERERRAHASDRQYGASAMVFNDTGATTKDPLRTTRFAQEVFRFVGRMADPGPNDGQRRFLVSYYLSDSTVSVYELVARNSGHQGGKIFARRAVRGIDSPRSLAAGQTVRLDGVDYTLDAVDARTQRMLDEGVPESMDDAYFHTGELIAKARQAALQRFPHTQDLFRYYASSSTRGLTRTNVAEIFTDAGLRLSGEEMDAVMARIDSNADGWVSIEDLTDRFLAQQFSSDFQPRRTLAALVAEGTDPDAVAIPRGPIRSAEAIASQADAARRADEALRQFLSLTEARRALLTRALRSAADATYDGNLGVDDFTSCVTKRLKVPMTAEELDDLVYKFFYAKGLPNWRSRRLPYNEVHRLIFL